jgi:hypothetical protein
VTEKLVAINPKLYPSDYTGDCRRSRLEGSRLWVRCFLKREMHAGNTTPHVIKKRVSQ